MLDRLVILFGFNNILAKLEHKLLGSCITGVQAIVSPLFCMFDKALRSAGMASHILLGIVIDFGEIGLEE